MQFLMLDQYHFYAFLLLFMAFHAMPHLHQLNVISLNISKYVVNVLFVIVIYEWMDHIAVDIHVNYLSCKFLMHVMVVVDLFGFLSQFQDVLGGNFTICFLSGELENSVILLLIITFLCHKVSWYWWNNIMPKLEALTSKLCSSDQVTFSSYLWHHFMSPGLQHSWIHQKIVKLKSFVFSSMPLSFVNPQT